MLNNLHFPEVASMPANQKKKRLTRTFLPSSVSNLAIPIATSSVRRSARLNEQKGFCAIRLDRELAKKCKISIIQINGNTDKTHLVSLDLLTSWGIDCGVASSKLTIDRLLQTPSSSNPRVDNDEDNADAC
jgi:hypothetical protein